MRTMASFLAAALWALSPVSAQEQAAADAPRVFLDCDYCDHTYIRTELKWVNWVRDAADAQIHVLVTRQSTGGGGAEWGMNFIGLKDFAGRTDTLKYVSSQDDTDDTIRQNMTRLLKAGMVPFLMNTSLGSRVQVSLAEAAAGAKSSSAPATDPWNFWVFSISVRANMDGESSQRFANYNGNVSASRTTAGYKMRVGASAGYNESQFDLDDTTRVTSVRENYSGNVMVVRSVGEHWSAGLQAGGNSATFGNITLGFTGGPALEWSLWPYAQASRKSFLLRYSPGVKSFNYREITIFDRMEETHPHHNLAAELVLRQRWGSSGFYLSVNQYLHDFQKYNATLFGNANVRVFKGFSLDFFGEYSHVRDDLALAKRELTDEEILLRQRQLRTAYRYFGSFGVRYSFGSIFNNVVNPRFGEVM